MSNGAGVHLHNLFLEKSNCQGILHLQSLLAEIKTLL